MTGEGKGQGARRCRQQCRPHAAAPRPPARRGALLMPLRVWPLKFRSGVWRFVCLFFVVLAVVLSASWKHG